MVDLADVLEAKRKQTAFERLNDVLTIVATNGRTMEDAEYKQFMNGLSKDTGVKQSNKFDRSKFEQLRAMTNQGANKAR